MEILDHFIKLDTDSQSNYYYDPITEKMYSDWRETAGHVSELKAYSAADPYNTTGAKAWKISDGRSKYSRRAKRRFITIHELRAAYPNQAMANKPLEPVAVPPVGIPFHESETPQIGQVIYTFDTVWISYIIEGRMGAVVEGNVPEGFKENIPTWYFLRRIGYDVNRRITDYRLREVFYKGV